MARITAEENIKAHKPLRENFRKEEAHTTAIDAWQGNIERNASFYGRLLQIVRDVIEERSKNDPVYKPIFDPRKSTFYNMKIKKDE